MDHGDFVVVKNIEQLIRFTGKKFQNKKYYRHTGHPGGIKDYNTRKTSKKKTSRKPEIGSKKNVAWTDLLEKNN